MKSNYSYFIRKKGRYFQLILRYKDNAGQWRQKTKSGYKNKRDITGEEKEKLLNKVNGLLSVDQTKGILTLREFTEMYLSDRRKTLARNTYISYKNAILKFPALLDMPMAKITYSHCIHAISALDYAPSTQKIFVTKLKGIFAAAVKYKAIPYNILSEYNHKTSRGQNHRLRTFTQNETSILLDTLHDKNQQIWIICAMMAYCGLRVSESLGITRRDIENNELSVNKQWQKDDNGIYTFTPLKTKNSCRKIPIPPKLKECIDEYIENQPVIRIDGRLTGINAGASLRNYIIPILPAHSPHDFRHTYATNLLANGVDIRTVASLLGDTVSTVENTYIHYTEEMRLKAADDIKRIFG